MSKSNIKVAEENIKKLRTYIKGNNKFPMHRGQLNKTQLLIDLGIGLAARQNVDIKTQLENLAIKLSQTPKLLLDSDNSDTDKNLRDCIRALEKKLNVSEECLAAYKKGFFAESFLVKTGRLIKQPRYQNSIDTTDK